MIFKCLASSLDSVSSMRASFLPPIFLSLTFAPSLASSGHPNDFWWMNGLETRVAPYGNRLYYYKIYSLLPATLNYNTLILFPEVRWTDSLTWRWNPACLLVAVNGHVFLLWRVPLSTSVISQWKYFTRWQQTVLCQLKVITNNFEKNNLLWLFK